MKEPSTTITSKSLETPQDLAYRLGTSYSKLCYTIYGVGVKNLYENFTVPKKSGENRVISAPYERLKQIQHRLKSVLCELYRPHDAASAFIEGRGIIYNASHHTRKKVVFNIDLKDFYSSINFGRVYGLLKAKPYCLRDEVARVIAHICCVGGVLPQGAPTSPVVSNMISRSLDHELSRLARKEKAYYTRYADDITFSFSKGDIENQVYRFEGGVVKVAEPLEEIVNSNGFHLNYKKTRINFSGERQVVTGLKVNRKVNVDRRYVRTTRAMIFALSKNLEEANKKFQESFGESRAKRLEHCVAGRINFIGMVKGVESSVYQTLASKFNNLELDVEVPVAPVDPKSALDESLHFYHHKKRSRLEHSIWVVDFEGVEGLELEQQLVQGTAFAVQGRKLYSCWHIFEKAGSNECCIYRISNPAVKYKAKVVKHCKVSDVAELEFLGKEPDNFRCLKIYNKADLHTGYRLAIVGFPEKQEGHSSVSIMPCVIINSFVKSKVSYYEVDKQVYSGASGAPVLNAFMQVVGMAAMGASIGGEGEDKVIEGANAFVSAVDFFKGAE